MAVGTSVAEELLNALKMPKLRPMPSYISEADTMSVEGLHAVQLCSRLHPRHKQHSLMW